MKFGIQSKWNTLSMNILIGIDDLKPKFKKLRNLGPKLRCFNFYEIWHLEQVEHPNYDYSNWNWLYWPKIIDSGKFGPKIEMCPMFTNSDTQN